MSATTSSEVLVVGAGPTGLALACRLKQLGMPVRLIDLKPGPSTTSKAIGLQYRVSEVLALMGVVDRFIAESTSPTVVNIRMGERLMLQFQFRPSGRVAGTDAFQPRALMIAQSRTENLLGDFFRDLGGRIEWGTELISHAQTLEGVQARLRYADGREDSWSGGWLVSCEGAHSVVRKQAGIEFQGKTYPLNFLLADVEISSGPHWGENQVWLHADGSVALLPLPGTNLWRIMAEVSANQPETHLSDQAIWDSVQEVLHKRIPGADQFHLGQPQWVSQFRIHCRMVDHYRKGRVFLAGDAAHIHSPTGGQGITTGVQDAVNLAWKLARVAGGAPEALLDTYEEERRPHAESVLHQTDRVTTVFFATSPIMRLLRDWLILPLLRTDMIQKRFFGKLTQLHVNNRGSRLARESGFLGWSRWGCPRAGDRCPDVAFQRIDNGSRLTILETLRPGKPVVLIGKPSDPALQARLMESLHRLDLETYRVVPSDSRNDTDPSRSLVDIHGDWRRIYGLSGDFLCLIRPDAHLGLIQRPIKLSELKAYLKQICLPQRVDQELVD